MSANNPVEHSDVSRVTVNGNGNGGSKFDPSANVLALSEASNERQDDLREASDRLFSAQIGHMKELIAAEKSRVNEQMVLRAEFSQQLSVGEAKRIDAIRAVDVNAVLVASQKASDQANVLATQVAQSAEAMRVLVASTSASVATNLQQFQTALSNRITTLEQGSYQDKGKQSFSDPAFVELLNEVKNLKQNQTAGEGKTAGLSMGWGWVVGGFGFIMTLVTIAGSLLLFFK